MTLQFFKIRLRNVNRHQGKPHLSGIGRRRLEGVLEGELVPIKYHFKKRVTWLEL
jgi:hypothetical protein